MIQRRSSTALAPAHGGGALTGDSSLGGAFAPEQAAALLEALPSVQPEVGEIVRMMLGWRDRPVGLGAHGTLHQFVEKIKPGLVWVNPDLYVFGEHQEDDPDEETLDALIASFESRQVVGQAGNVEQHAWAPLLVVERPNPDYPDQTLMLVRGLDTLRVARAVRWSGIEAIVYPDMGDDAIRTIGLHLAFRESRPPVWEALRHIFPLELAANAHAARRGRPRAGESRITDESLAAMIGCDRSYIARLRRFWMTPALREMVARGRLSLRVALKSVDLLGRHPELQERVVGYIAEHGLDATEAEAYMKQQASHARGEPTTWPRERRPALPAPAPAAAAAAQAHTAGAAAPASRAAAPVVDATPVPASRVAPATALLQQRTNDLWNALEAFAAAVGQDARLGRPARIIKLLEEALSETDALLQERGTR